MRQKLSFWSIKNFKRNATVKILVSALLFSALQVVAISVSPIANAASGDPGSISFGNSAKTNYLTYPKTTAFGFGTSDFTIEYWWKPTVGGRNDVFDLKNQTIGETTVTRMDLGYSIDGGGLKLYTDGGCGLDSGKSLVLNKWIHIALTRNGNNLNLWLDGVLGKTTACSADFGSAGYALQLIYENGGGNLTNIRVVKGTAMYSTTFAPSTSPLAKVAGTSLLLNATQGTDFLKDSSDNNLVPTVSGSPSSSSSNPQMGSFCIDGSSVSNTIVGSLSVTDPSAIGTGDFTLETWVYLRGTYSYTSIIDSGGWVGAGTNGGIQLYENGQLSNGTATFGYGGVIGSASGLAVSYNKWFHLAISRASSVNRMFINGVQSGNDVTDSINLTQRTYTLGDGAFWGMDGCLAGVTLTHRALYTSNFEENLPYPTTRTVPSDAVIAIVARDDGFTNKGSGSAPTKSGTVYFSSDLPISKTTPTLSWSDATKTYGDSSFTLATPTSNTPGLWTYSSATTSVISLSGTTSSATVGAVGSSLVTATFTPTDTVNYKSGSTTTMTVTVGKATPAFTWGNVTKTFGDSGFTLTPPTVTGSVQGTFVYSSGTSSVISLSGTTSSATVVALGTSTITATFTPTNTSNYISGGTSTIVVTVDKASPTFTWSPVTKTYGDAAFPLTSPTVTGSIEGTFTYGSGSPAVVSLSGGTATISGAGTSIITGTFTPTDAANYVSNGTTTMTVIVGKAPLGITASSHTVAFGAAIPTITPSYSGFVNGEGSSVLSNLVCTTTYTTTTSVGTTGSSCSGATASNYSIVYTAGVITVTQGGQTSALTISSTSVTYGSTLSLITGGGTGSGLNSFVVDSGPCTVSGSTLSTTAAGTCMVTATKAANGNYLVSSSTSTAITVNPKGLAINGLTGVNKEFDHGVVGTVTGTPTLFGTVGSDDVILAGTPTFTFATVDVATGKTVTASGYTLTGTTAGNYTLTQPTVTANITAKAARVTATNTTVAFGAAVTSGVTASGLISPDAVGSASYTYTGTGTSTPPTAVGVYTVTPSNAVFSAGSIGNYSISYDTATVTILAKYTITYNANGGVIGSNSTTSADFVVGDTALALPTTTREGFNFLGWFTLESNGIQLTGAYTPSATATLWAHWIQKSLVGVGNSQKIGTITTLANVGNTYSATSTSGTVAVTYVANALPVGTVIDIYQMSDSSRASSIISSTNNYVLSLVIAWLTPTKTVPLLSANDALTMVITDSAIKKGAKVYSLIGSDSTLLGTATADGSVTVRILEDPEVYIAITKPDAPTGVSATSGGNASTTLSWTAPSDGGSAITGYTATSNAGQTCSSTTTTTCSMTGLTNGTPYTFTVTATNTIGTSDPSSASASATPAAPIVITPQVVTPPSSGGGGGYTYVEPTPTVDPAVVAAALAAQKALVEKAAAEAKVVAAAKAAAEAKALAEKKAADEAELAAIIKALQEKADAESLVAAKKLQDELVAAQLKADEELRVATALQLAEEQRVATEKAVALAASKKITTVYSTTAAFKLNKTYTNRLNLYSKRISLGSTVTCIGYAKSSKTLSYAKAKVVATKQAKALCSSMKKINPTLKVKSIVYPVSKAPKTTVNKIWVPVSYRVEVAVN
jgi:hypothetical protein